MLAETQNAIGILKEVYHLYIFGILMMEASQVLFF